MTIIFQVVRAKKSTIAKVFGPVFAIFALIAGQIRNWWITLVLLFALGILTALALFSWSSCVGTGDSPPSLPLRPKEWRPLPSNSTQWNEAAGDSGGVTSASRSGSKTC